MGASLRACAGYPGRSLAPVSRRQPVEAPAADGPAHEAQGGVAHRGCHPPDLPVAPLAQGQAQPAIGHGLAHPHRRIAWPQIGRCDPLGTGRAGGAVLQRDAVAQRLQCRVVRQPLDLHEVGLGQLEPRIGDARLQPPVIGEKKEPLAVAVEPAGRVDAGQVDMARERVAQTRRLGPGPATGELRQHAEGLVEEDQTGRGGGRAGHGLLRVALGRRRQFHQLSAPSETANRPPPARLRRCAVLPQRLRAWGGEV